MKTDELLAFLQEQKVITWVDQCLFMDHFRERRAYPPVQPEGTLDDFKKE